jgi:hypothetical protein
MSWGLASSVWPSRGGGHCSPGRQKTLRERTRSNTHPQTPLQALLHHILLERSGWVPLRDIPGRGCSGLPHGAPSGAAGGPGRGVRGPSVQRRAEGMTPLRGQDSSRRPWCLLLERLAWCSTGRCLSPRNEGIAPTRYQRVGTSREPRQRLAVRPGTWRATPASTPQHRPPPRHVRLFRPKLSLGRTFPGAFRATPPTTPPKSWPKHYCTTVPNACVPDVCAMLLPTFCSCSRWGMGGDRMATREPKWRGTAVGICTCTYPCLTQTGSGCWYRFCARASGSSGSIISSL